MPGTMELIADPMRREILRRIWETELPVNSLVATFDVSQPAISFHLRVLRQGGLVRVRQQGTSATTVRCRRLSENCASIWKRIGRTECRASRTRRSSKRGGTDAVCDSFDLTQEIDIDASPDLVFRFFTDAELLARWLCVRGEVDPTPGGSFKLNVTGIHVTRGTFQELEPGAGWSSHGCSNTSSRRYRRPWR